MGDSTTNPPGGWLVPPSALKGWVVSPPTLHSWLRWMIAPPQPSREDRWLYYPNPPGIGDSNNPPGEECSHPNPPGAPQDTVWVELQNEYTQNYHNSRHHRGSQFTRAVPGPTVLPSRNNMAISFMNYWPITERDFFMANQYQGRIGAANQRKADDLFLALLISFNFHIIIL